MVVVVKIWVKIGEK